MANTIEIFNSKFSKDKLIGDNNFFNNQEEVKEFNKLQKKYISNVDYSSPANFARFGSAEEYYKNAINYINNDYPYDNSTADKLNWINSLNEFEYHVFNSEYPRAVGYTNVSESQYIRVYSHVKEENITAKDSYESGARLTANTYLHLDDGFTFEAWLKFSDSSQNTEVLKVNAFTGSISEQVYINLLTISRNTGSNPYFSITDSIHTYNFATPIQDNEWHHYVFFVSNELSTLSVDGVLTEEISNTVLAPGLETYIFVPLGLMWLPLYEAAAFTAHYDQSSVFEIGGGGLMSIDEARFWNGKRTVEKIGRYWFTNIDGNDFSDPDNSKLLFYYKFNEGWNSEYQLLCLDYSGRDNDGEIVGYENSCRTALSAINESGLVHDFEKPEIIYKGLSYSQTVKQFLDDKIVTAKLYDETNPHLLYNKFPSWVLEQEEERETKHLKQIIQIIASYFDDLFNKIGEITEYKKIRLDSNKENIYPFYDKILTSTGFDVTELFSNVDIIEKIASRNDIDLHEQEMEKIKNSIFKNIYNNLAYILKSKGTEKSLRSFLRSYGLGEDLVRVNLYADGSEYGASDRSREAIVKKKTITLTGDNTVYLSSSPISEDINLSYYTLETCLTFPHNLKANAPITASLFGLQNNSSDVDKAWSTVNYHFYVTLENNLLSGSRFVLNDSYANMSSSQYYENLYDDSAWNLVLRKKPVIDTLNGFSGVPNYTLELYGVNKNAHIQQEFSCSLPYPAVDGYIRHYIGARKEDMDGNTLYDANSKFLYCNFWTNYLDNETVISHNKDILNYGVNE